MAEDQLVIDTHILIWMANGDAQLTVAARKAINNAAFSGRVLVPAICIWEIAMLVGAGRVRVGKSVHNWVEDALSAPGFVLAPLTPSVAIESCNLPGEFHGDPADRMIVATARIEGALLLSKDKRILIYGKQGHVQVA